MSKLSFASMAFAKLSGKGMHDGDIAQRNARLHRAETTTESLFDEAAQCGCLLAAPMSAVRTLGRIRQTEINHSAVFELTEKGVVQVHDLHGVPICELYGPVRADAMAVSEDTLTLYLGSKKYPLSLERIQGVDMDVPKMPLPVSGPVSVKPFAGFLFVRAGRSLRVLCSSRGMFAFAGFCLMSLLGFAFSVAFLSYLPLILSMGLGCLVALWAMIRPGPVRLTSDWLLSAGILVFSLVCIIAYIFI